MTNLVMGILLAGMTYLLLWNVRVTETAEHFFDHFNTTVLRGFWSLVIILVHIPKPYQNTLQDMVGSFAYIGVTFFFMTSAYGLKKSVESHGVQNFWSRRLSKLLVPLVMINLITVCICMAITGVFSPAILVWMHPWVFWLLICYFLFWLVYRLEGIPCKDTLVCVGIVVFSLYRYMVSPDSGWQTEIYGFLWGILLANGKLCRQQDLTAKTWIGRCVILLAASLTLGLLYLRYKFVVFWGSYVLKILLGFVILLFMLSVHKKLRFGNKVGYWLGCISYEIYLMHVALIHFIFPAKQDWSSGAYICCLVLLTILLSAVANKISSLILKKVNCWRINKNG